MWIIGSVSPEGFWWGDFLQSDCRDLLELDTAEVHVKRMKSHEVLANALYEFPCANGTIKTADRHRPLSYAEGDLEQEDHVEFERAIAKEGSIKDFWSMTRAHQDAPTEGPRATGSRV